MGNIWSSENRFRKWLEVEICACEAIFNQGIIPNKSWENIRENADFELARIEEIEKTVKHELIAFLTAVGEKIGDDSSYVHKGLTSSDVMDTAQSIQMKESLDLIIEGINKLLEILKARAIEHKHTIMVGRSHGIHAEPITFGLKLLMFYEEMKRNLTRIKNARETIAVGKISGAVGTYSNIEPYVEEFVCQKLGLKIATVSNQILQRDRHAEYMASLGILAGSLEKIALEIRNLQRTDVHEVEEGFAKGQKGSSAMPHKKNPEICERICGLSRVIKSNVQAALDNIALWHERDLTHTSVERVIIPDSSILADYILDKMCWVLENLKVFPDRMKQNMDAIGGLVFSQCILVALADKGIDRQKAYELVQKNSMRVWQEGGNLQDLAKQDKDIMNVLTEKEIDNCFSLDRCLKMADYIFNRVGL